MVDGEGVGTVRPTPVVGEFTMDRVIFTFGKIKEHLFRDEERFRKDFLTPTAPPYNMKRVAPIRVKEGVFVYLAKGEQQYRYRPNVLSPEITCRKNSESEGYPNSIEGDRG